MGGIPQRKRRRAAYPRRYIERFKREAPVSSMRVELDQPALLRRQLRTAHVPIRVHRSYLAETHDQRTSAHVTACAPTSALPVCGAYATPSTRARGCHRWRKRGRIHGTTSIAALSSASAATCGAAYTAGALPLPSTSNSRSGGDLCTTQQLGAVAARACVSCRHIKGCGRARAPGAPVPHLYAHRHPRAQSQYSLMVKLQGRWEGEEDLIVARLWSSAQREAGMCSRAEPSALPTCRTSPCPAAHVFLGVRVHPRQRQTRRGCKTTARAMSCLAPYGPRVPAARASGTSPILASMRAHRRSSPPLMRGGLGAQCSSSHSSAACGPDVSLLPAAHTPRFVGEARAARR
ncbi:hypothetical protein FB451DRAFT_1375587 [Mycena latifolia]|nr:hypothetical protein FB451DRAFT_1375587 [Mycena latifolia]